MRFPTFDAAEERCARRKTSQQVLLQACLFTVQGWWALPALCPNGEVARVAAVLSFVLLRTAPPLSL